MKKIQSKVRALERSQHYPSVLRCSRGANFTVQDPNRPHFEPIREFMYVRIACKNEEDPIKSEGTGVVTTFHPL